MVFACLDFLDICLTPLKLPILQGKDFLRDLHSKAKRLHSIGDSIAVTQKSLAFLLPSLAVSLDSVGLPTEAQLLQMIAARQHQDMAAGAAAIVDAVAPIQQDKRFQQVQVADRERRIDYLWAGQI